MWLTIFNMLCKLAGDICGNNGNKNKSDRQVYAEQTGRTVRTLLRSIASVQRRRIRREAKMRRGSRQST